MTMFKKLALIGALALIPAGAWLQSKLTDGCACGASCTCASCQCDKGHLSRRVEPGRPRDPLDADMARLGRGDRSVFTSVFQRLFPMVRAYAARMTSEADADDAAQSALVKVFEQAAAYDPTRPAAAWALAITAWECRTLQKRAARRRTEPLEAAQAVAADGLDPESAALRSEMVDAAREAFGALGEADKDTLLAAFSADADARLAGGATFRKRKERALDRLRDLLRKLHG